MALVNGQISFVFCREGTSDDGLLPHLRELILRAGALEVQGTSRPDGPPVGAQLARLVKEDLSPELVFVHRDADSAGAPARRQEILAAAASCGIRTPVVPVIPIRMMEAWLLLSEAEIRRVVGKPSGRAPLSLPALGELERKADPKGILHEALLAASESTGRRRRADARAFDIRRKILLDRLDIDGPIRGLPGWQHLVTDIEQAIAGLSHS